MSGQGACPCVRARPASASSRSQLISARSRCAASTPRTPVRGGDESRDLVLIGASPERATAAATNGDRRPVAVGRFRLTRRRADTVTRVGHRTLPPIDGPARGASRRCRSFPSRTHPTRSCSPCSSASPRDSTNRRFRNADTRTHDARDERSTIAHDARRRRSRRRSTRPAARIPKPTAPARPPPATGAHPLERRGAGRGSRIADRTVSSFRVAGGRSLTRSVRRTTTRRERILTRISLAPSLIAVAGTVVVLRLPVGTRPELSAPKQDRAQTTQKRDQPSRRNAERCERERARSKTRTAEAYDLAP